MSEPMSSCELFYSSWRLQAGRAFWKKGEAWRKTLAQSVPNAAAQRSREADEQTQVCVKESSEVSERLGAEIRLLTQRIARGEQKAVELLYELLTPYLSRYVSTLVETPQDLEDVVQAFFVRVCCSPQRVVRAERPYAYCLRMIRNEALKLARQHQRARRPREKEGRKKETSPETSAQQAELCQRVRRALKRLPEEQAEVVVLKVWEGLTFAEIAEVLDESANTVASRYRYALEKLARLLLIRGESEA